MFFPGQLAKSGEIAGEGNDLKPENNYKNSLTVVNCTRPTDLGISHVTNERRVDGMNPHRKMSVRKSRFCWDCHFMSINLGMEFAMMGNVGRV
jgi:hypothetical protein